MSRRDFDLDLPTDAHDETAALAVAFNHMAAELKRLTASRDELNREIAARRTQPIGSS